MLGSKLVADISLEYLMAKQKQNLEKKMQASNPNVENVNLQFEK